MDCKCNFSAAFFFPFCCIRSLICFNAAGGEKVQRMHICLNSQMFKQMCSLCIFNSLLSLIKLCLINVVDIPLESHVLFLHFYFNSLFLTENALNYLLRKPPVQKEWWAGVVYICSVEHMIFQF